MTTIRKLSGRARKAVLLVHILSAAAWLGIDLALGILAVVALSTEDRNTAGIAIQAVDLFAIWPMFGASVVCMISGVVLGVGSKYGLVRYWWVAIKLFMNVGMSLLIAFSLRPGVEEAAQVGKRRLPREGPSRIAELLRFVDSPGARSRLRVEKDLQAVLRLKYLHLILVPRLPPQVERSTHQHARLVFRLDPKDVGLH